MKFFMHPLCILIVMLFINSQALNAQEVKRGPYLQSGTASSIIIKWRTDDKTSSKVWYGTTPGSLNRTVYLSDKVKDHEVLIDGLNSKTKYYYAIGNKDKVLAGDEREYYFKTAPEIGERGSYRAWVLGDCGTGNSTARDVRDAFYDYVGDGHTDMILLTGDNAYPDGTDSDYQNAIFEDMYNDKLINSVVWASPGNHDYDNGYTDGDEETGPYYDIFSFPRNAEAGGVASGSEAFYSYDYGNMHFISLDSDDVSRDLDGPMLTWLKNDLAATNQEWIIVFFHHPPYTKGSHDSDDTGDSGGRMRDMRENVIPILENYKVDLVLSGHSHSYERSHMAHGHYGKSNTLESSMILDNGNGRRDQDGSYKKRKSVDDGTVYIVTGTAGKTSDGDFDHPIMYYSDNPEGSTILEVEGAELTVLFLNENGNIDDYFTIAKLEADCLPEGTSCNDGDSSTINDVEDGNCNCKGIPNGDTTICQRISSKKDDVEENGENGKMADNSSDLELTYDSKNGKSNQIVGLRYPNLGIPQGADILEATIQFTVDEKNSEFTNLQIYGEAANHSNSFRDNRYELTERSSTNARVNWQPAPWTSVDEAGPDQRTPDLSSIIQEIVRRPSYSKNSAISLIIKGEGERTARSYDKSKSKAPMICITYSACPVAGTTCDDNDPCTINDQTDEFCNCKGTFEDTDNDGVCNAKDLCPGFDDTVDDDQDGIPDSCDDCDGLTVDNECDDDDDCTINDVYDTACNCEGVFADADGDGFCVTDDVDDTDPCEPDPDRGGCDPDLDCLTIEYVDFESGWGLWRDGGEDCIRNYWDSDMAKSGETSIELRDGTGSNASIYTDPLDLSSFNSAIINFSFIADDMEFGKDFFLEVSLDGGDNYEIVEEWDAGRDFENLIRQEALVEISGFDFTDETVIRLRCDASCDEDMVFIDDLKLEACFNAGNRIAYDPEEDQASLFNNFSVNVYPNPIVAGEALHLDVNGAKEFLRIYIYDRLGVMQKMYKVSNPTAPFIEIPTDYLELGVYVVKLETQGGTLTEKILVIR